MSQSQKIIKYLAIAFALFLTFSIISGIIYGVSFIFDLSNDNSRSITEKLDNLEIDKASSFLDIDVLSSNIKIKKGDTFKIKTNNKYISSREEKNKLYIKERKHNWFHKNENNELIVYIPDDFVFDSVEIESGAGKIIVYELSTKQIYLDLGAGKVKINRLTVFENSKIEGGAGEVLIEHSNIHNLDLEMGAGRLSLISKLTGNNKIESGVGKIALSLLGNIDDYRITLDKGLGSAIIDGKNMSSDTIYGTGKSKLDIDGGVGSIKIDFIEE